MKNLAIICVDDERMILDGLKSALRHSIGEKYLIEVAEDGHEGLSLLDELLEDGYEIPLIIADYIMPGMKGDELLIQMHLRVPKSLKILLTGQANLEGVIRAVNQANLYRYIAKPWQPSDLDFTVNTALQSYFQDQQLAQKTLELELLNKAYARFVPTQFLKLLGKSNIQEIHLGSEIQQEMTVLFADIRGFTSLSEKMSVQDNFRFINAYLSRMQPVINQHNGFIDKYIGDAIMALFPHGADDALQAAISMLHTLQDYNQTRQRPERPPFQIGIGINTGLLMLGTVGSKERMEGTVIADAVNLAARIEQLTKTYECDLLISDATRQQLSPEQPYLLRKVDQVTVKGKTQAVTLYEVFNADPAPIIALKQQTLTTFETGLTCFHSEAFSEALTYFKVVLQQHPQDTLAQRYVAHCQQVLEMMGTQIPTILIVDDMPDNIRVLFVGLEEAGYALLVAEEGETALQIAEVEQPTVILLDVMMPGMDGMETCQHLKANPKTQHIPIIFMTALNDMPNKLKAFQVGAADYITKPFQYEEVLARVKTQITVQRMYRHLTYRNKELEINNLHLKEKIQAQAQANLSNAVCLMR